MKKIHAISLSDRSAAGIEHYRNRIRSAAAAAAQPRAQLRDGVIEHAVDDVIAKDYSDNAGLKAALALDGEAPVRVYINSPGGSVWEGIAMYHTLLERAKTTEVVAVIDGIAASAATVIAMGAGRIVAASQASSMLIHCAWTLALGNTHVMAATSADLAKIDRQLAKIYSGRMGSVESVLQMMEEDKILDAEEALDLGLIDSIENQQEESDTEPAAENHDDFWLHLELATAAP